MNPIAFTLSDADGLAHVYELIPHPASEGQRVMWTLLQLGAEPLGRLIGQALPALEGIGSLRQLLDDPAALAAIGGKIDFAQVGADVRRSVGSMPMDSLVKELLSRCTRDGKPLSNPLAFDASYTRNYREMLLAAWKSVEANRFFALLPT